MRANLPDIGQPLEAHSHAEACDIIARVVARGSLIQQPSGRYYQREPNDSSRYGAILFLCAHPDLDDGEIYAIFTQDCSPSGSVYRCSPSDALAILNDPSCYNWC
jgi:hypothetical protein